MGNTSCLAPFTHSLLGSCAHACPLAIFIVIAKKSRRLRDSRNRCEQRYVISFLFDRPTRYEQCADRAFRSKRNFGCVVVVGNVLISSEERKFRLEKFSPAFGAPASDPNIVFSSATTYFSRAFFKELSLGDVQIFFSIINSPLQEFIEVLKRLILIIKNKEFTSKMLRRTN